MKPKKTLTYEIKAEWVRTISGEDHGQPTAKIIIEFPQVVDDLPAFRAALESVFAEVLEVCK